jgi:glyoxylase-like metal-dependent hydrolase (beta-lactamase superfamily II)
VSAPGKGIRLGSDRCLRGLLLFVLAGSAPPVFGDSVTCTERTINKLAEGIYEIRHPDAPDGFPQGNTTVIIGQRGVLVVDSGLLPSSTRADIEQIRRWTDKPVLYVVNTHWHSDHSLGNGLYVQAFPYVQVIAQVETQRLIRDVNPAAIARYPLRKERTELALASGKKADGSPLTEGERKRYEQRLAGLVPTLEELKARVDFAPNVAFEQSLDIDLGNRAVRARFLGRGNTSGDTIVYLPGEKILIAGDLLVHPVPYFFGAFATEHAKTLDRMAQFDAETIVPGHGEVLHGKGYIYQVRDLLNAVNAFIETQINAGVQTSEETEALLNELPEVAKWRDQFAGNDPRNRNFFDVNLHALVSVAFEQIGTR